MYSTDPTTYGRELEIADDLGRDTICEKANA